MKFYMTFGCLHPLSEGWIEIEADSRDKARDLAFRTFGEHWSFVYSEEEFDPKAFPGSKLGRTLRAD